MLLSRVTADMYQLHRKRQDCFYAYGLDVSITTPADCKDSYAGITPELVPDFYGLKGDSSDNIPGVP